MRVGRRLTVVINAGCWSRASPSTLRARVLAHVDCKMMAVGSKRKRKLFYLVDAWRCREQEARSWTSREPDRNLHARTSSGSKGQREGKSRENDPVIRRFVGRKRPARIAGSCSGCWRILRVVATARYKTIVRHRSGVSRDKNYTTTVLSRAVN